MNQTPTQTPKPKTAPKSRKPAAPKVTIMPPLAAPLTNKELALTLLRFSFDNSKLQGQGIAGFSLPAGITCPSADACRSKFNRDTHKVQDGPNTRHRCFFASMEASWRSLSNMTDANLAKLRAARTVEKMADLIEASLPQRGYKTIRIHIGGDFFNENYFLAWMEVARRNKDREFYAYTKELKTWLKFRKLVPKNVALTASYGGLHDALIKKHRLRHSVVVFHPDEAAALGLPIDHDDSHARDRKCKAFALLIHNTQPAGSAASAAVKRLKQEKVNFSYGRAASAAPGS